jgi:hypothetical protein
MLRLRHARAHWFTAGSLHWCCGFPQRNRRSLINSGAPRMRSPGVRGASRGIIDCSSIEAWEGLCANKVMQLVLSCVIWARDGICRPERSGIGPIHRVDGYIIVFDCSIRQHGRHYISCRIREFVSFPMTCRIFWPLISSHRYWFVHYVWRYESMQADTELSAWLVNSVLWFFFIFWFLSSFLSF